MLLGEALQRQTLFGVGAAVHDQHGLRGIIGSDEMPEGVLGADHADHAEAGDSSTPCQAPLLIFQPKTASLPTARLRRWRSTGRCRHRRCGLRCSCRTRCAAGRPAAKETEAAAQTRRQCTELSASQIVPLGFIIAR